MRRRTRKLGAGVAGSVMSLALVAASGWAAPSQADEARTLVGTPAGTAASAGVLVNYSDRETFFPGAATPAPTTTVALAGGSFDNAGSGHAGAALAYNPYEEFGGAINSLTPPPFPQLPFDEIRAHQYAVVDGEAPQAKDASLGAPNPVLRVGTVKAALEEAGPAAVAETAVLGAKPAPEVVVDSANTTIRVVRAGGQAVSTATTVLDGVTLGGVLRLESIVLTATSTADGAAGKSSATARVSGAVVGGTPVEITGDGIVVSGSSVPANGKAVAEALKGAGLELLAPGGHTVQPAAQDSRAEARGPSFRMKTAEGRYFEVTVGLASTSSVLFDVTRPTTEASAGTGEAAQSSSEPVTVPGGEVAVAAPASAPASPLPSAEPAAPSVWPAWPDDAANVPQEARLSPAGSEELVIQTPSSGPAAQPVQLAAYEEARRVNVFYGAFALAGLGLALAVFGLPRGERWAEDG